MPRALARTLLIAMLLGTLQLISPSAAIAGATLRIDRVKTGLNAPSAFTFAPDGNIWYLERGTGRIVVLDRATGNQRRFFRISGVDASGERGALGIALHPRWPAARAVFVYVTRLGGGRLWNELVKISGGRMRVLLRSPVDQSANHNGGRILFGPDRKLYVLIGDGGSEYPKDPRHSQDLTNELRGKILRLDRDGTAARGNPFGRVWAYGIRNSFGFTFDPRTGRLWETENGPTCNDEINRIVKGGNYAWGPNQDCGSEPAPGDTNKDGPSRILPETYFVNPIGITGAAFCESCRLASSYEGKLLFSNVNSGQIRMSTLSANRRRITSTTILRGTPNGNVHSMEVAPSGRIFFSDYTGIYRLVFV